MVVLQQNEGKKMLACASLFTLATTKRLSPLFLRRFVFFSLACAIFSLQTVFR